MREEEIKGCLLLIQEWTGCSYEIAKQIYKLTAEYSGGNTPDEWSYFYNKKK